MSLKSRAIKRSAATAVEATAGAIAVRWASSPCEHRWDIRMLGGEMAGLYTSLLAKNS
jgi:hypothetical protein